MSRDQHNGRDTSRYSCSSRVSGTNVSYSSNFSAIKSNLLKFKNKKNENAFGVTKYPMPAMIAMTHRQSTKTPTKFTYGTQLSSALRTAQINLKSYDKGNDKSQASTERRKNQLSTANQFKYASNIVSTSR